jgi:WD40 repeat protein
MTGRLIGLIGLVGIVLTASLPAAAADDLTTAPILRIETGQHGAAINKLAVHAADQVAVSVSDDKTARVWSLANGEPLAVLRGPIGDGAEGALYAVALSPSGKTVAAAGYTGLSADRTSSIYLFGRDAGNWIGRITMGETQTDAINHIAFSPDGNAIAVAANDSKGLRIVVPGQRSIKVVDAEYKDAIVWVEFAPDGRLVASSIDGGVRLYDASFKRIAQWKADAGAKPWAASFSPDGKRIAVGLLGVPKVTVLSATDLKLAQSFAGAQGRTGGFSVLAWSRDGASLYAAGTYGETSGRKLIRRWPVGGGNAAEIAVGDDTVTDLKQLAEGGVAFSTAEPAWGVLGKDDKLALRKGRLQADFRDGYQGGFQASPDGAQVSFGFVQGGRKRARIDLIAAQLDNIADSTLSAAAKDKAGNVTVTDWRNGTQPKISGAPVQLDQGERSRSVVVGADGVALGTDYFVRFYRAGKQVWRAAVPAPAWAIDLAPQAGYVVVGLGDGSIRWLRANDGAERLGFYAEPEGGRWVAWTPEGLFDHGTGGESLIGYHQNQFDQGRPRGAAFVRVEQLYGTLYRRDLVVKRLRGGGDEEIRELVAKVGDIKTMLGRGLPPALKLIEICGRMEGQQRCQPIGLEQTLRGSKGKVQPITLDSQEVNLKFEVEDRGGGYGPVVLRRQGAPVATGGSTRSVQGKVRQEERNVTLQPGLNVVALSVFNGAKEIETDPKERPALALRVQVPVNDKPRVHVLAIGVDKFVSPQIPKLVNAANDARGIVESLQQDKKREVYSEVDAILLTDEKATLKAITDGFEKLAATAKPDDLTVVFLAGHGIAVDGKYYYIPYDMPAMTQAAIVEHGLTHERLTQLLSKLPTARTMVVLDTCFSGAFAIGDSIQRESRDQTVGRQISHSSGRFILAGSASHQEALDGIDGHGVLTGVLLKGLAGEADAGSRGDKDGKVNILELGEFAKLQVPTIARQVGRGHEQKPRWFFNGDDMFNVRSVD